MVGITEFDEQHKKLIALINKLYDAMKEGDGKKVLKKNILWNLIIQGKLNTWRNIIPLGKVCQT